MVVMWLTLGVLFLLLMLGLITFVYSVRLGVNPDDAHKIDPIPKENKDKK
jgi:hypothetical protein